MNVFKNHSPFLRILFILNLHFIDCCNLINVDFLKKKINKNPFCYVCIFYVVFYHFSFRATLYFPFGLCQQSTLIDQGIHNGKSKVSHNEEMKKRNK